MVKPLNTRFPEFGTPQKDVFLNGVPAHVVAHQTGKSFLLEDSDLQKQFGLTAAQASRTLRFISGEVATRDRKHPLFINFSKVRASLAPKNLCDVGAKECFIVDRASPYHRVLPSGNWNRDARQELQAWLGKLELYRPETRVVLAGVEGVLMTGNPTDVVAQSAADIGLIPDERLEKLNSLKNQGMTDAYTFGKRNLFEGVSLRKLTVSLRRASLKDSGFPRAYKEMQLLMNHLHSRGVAVGYVTDEPLAVMAPLMDHLGFKNPLTSIEATETYVLKPGLTDSTQAVALSKLLKDKSVKNWGEVIEKYGDYTIVSKNVGTVPSLTRTKRAGQKFVEDWKREKGIKTPLQLAGVFGNQWKSEMAFGAPRRQETGNDRGLLEVAPFMKGAIIFNLFPTHLYQDPKMSVAERKKREALGLPTDKDMNRLFKGRPRRSLFRRKISFGGRGLIRHQEFEKMMDQIDRKKPNLNIRGIEQVTLPKEGRLVSGGIPNAL